MTLNISKCGHISRRSDLTPLYINRELIRNVESYDYLGFPIKSGGIDFVTYLERRIKAAT